METNANPMSGPALVRGLLNSAEAMLVVVAHPDDESFGLGAVLEQVSREDTSATVLCFTHGEASTLGGNHDDLGTLRARELDGAAEVLGLQRTVLLDYADGSLADVPLGDLVAHVRSVAAEVDPAYLLAFDPGGVTSHPDHVRATEAALAAADELGLPVLGWTLPARIADQLNAEFGTALIGTAPEEVDHVLPVSRALQRQAISCHQSQSTDNPLLYRRLELLGESEHLRLLHNGRSRTAS
ncbi:MAG: PIG-L family deacetylase [Actinocatenispora sp.]